MIRFLAKIGYCCRALIYFTIGALAMIKISSFKPSGSSGNYTNPKESILVLHSNQYGMLLLSLLFLGLMGYVVWRLVQAIKDPDGHGRNPKGWIIRSSCFISAITHSSLAFFTLKLILPSLVGSSSKNSDSQTHIIAKVMEMPFGRILVAILGLILIGVATSQFYKAFKSSYRKHLDLPHGYGVLDWVCKIGLSGRGLVFLLVGGFLVYSAFKYDPAQSKGMKELWPFLAQLPQGNLLVGFLALSLMLFGLYSLLEAFYRKIRI